MIVGSGAPVNTAASDSPRVQQVQFQCDVVGNELVQGYFEEEHPDEIQLMPQHKVFQALSLQMPTGFRDVRLEAAYREKQRVDLARRLKWAGVTALVAWIILMVPIIWQSLRDSGSIFGEHGDDQDKDKVRIGVRVVHFVGLTIPAGLLLLPLTTSRYEKLELSTIFLVLVTVTLLQCMGRERLALLFGLPQSAMASIGNGSDSATVLLISTTVMLAFALPVRCSTSWLMTFFIPLIFFCLTWPLPEGVLDTGGGRVIPFSLLICLQVCVGLINRRTLELADRRLFVNMHSIKCNLTKEKVLRCMAEHEAETGRTQHLPKTRPKGTATGSECSHVTKNTACGSSVILDLDDYNSSDQSMPQMLEAIKNLGRDEHWLVDTSRFEVFSKFRLGSGGFGSVCLGRLYGSLTAVKLISDIDFSKLSSIVTELRILRRIRHPGIVTFFGAAIDADAREIVLVEEHIAGIPLEEAMSSRRPLDLEVRHRMLLGVGNALIYLHDQKPSILHGDLKSANILVTKKYHPKLIDFGLSKLIDGRSLAEGGTVRWSAPEMFAKTVRTASLASDVFSFGRIVYYILTGCKPLFNLKKDELLQCIDRKELPDMDWQEVSLVCPDEAKNLAESCCSWDPRDRPSMDDVIRELYSWKLDRYSDPTKSPSSSASRSSIESVLPQTIGTKQNPDIWLEAVAAMREATRLAELRKSGRRTPDGDGKNRLAL
eukprot:TRINITY_DN49155_c0_g1_i1.p1 TRINITY_DN49155_c0_g1~~TRINITY_DN49155_c0_g1_i1.p1  ORF type:complete len:713 (+),score=113.31 TRINITY_DN49155_c0_g1_i1:33-2171(+)